MTLRQYFPLALAAGIGMAAGAGGMAVGQEGVAVVDTGVLETDAVRALETDLRALCGSGDRAIAAITDLRRRRAEVSIMTDGQRYTIAIPTSAGNVSMQIPARQPTGP